jgi:hypothetical protein
MRSAAACRSDGLFDLAVNGDGVLTVQIEKDGHLMASAW